MGRVFLIKFDQTVTPFIDFYVCRHCQTHIALEEQREFTNTTDNELKGAVFGNAINWHALEENQNRRIGDYVVAEIYCNNCGSPLGFQFIEILDEFEVLIKEKHILLHLSKLLLWDGYDQFVPAEHEVVVPAEHEVVVPAEHEVDGNDVVPAEHEVVVPAEHEVVVPAEHEVDGNDVVPAENDN